MPESKLPPGPWKAIGDIDEIQDALGQWVLVGTDTGEIATVSPDVLRAVLALPELVEAAKGVVDKDWNYSPTMAALESALARIDGDA